MYLYVCVCVCVNVTCICHEPGIVNTTYLVTYISLYVYTHTLSLPPSLSLPPLTNQNSVGKGRLSMATLYTIHERLLEDINNAGGDPAGTGGGGGRGPIDDIYVSVGVEKLGLGEDGGSGERDPCVLGERKFLLKPAADVMAAALSQVILLPTPYTLYPIPYTLHSTPCTLYPTPYTLHPTPYTLHPAHPAHPAPYTLRVCVCVCVCVYNMTVCYDRAGAHVRRARQSS